MNRRRPPFSQALWALAPIAVFVVPLVLYIPEVAAEFLSIHGGFAPGEGGAAWTLSFTVVTALAGAFVFRGLQRWAWIFLLLCLGYSHMGAAVLRSQWSGIWLRRLSDPVCAASAMQIALLLTVPVAAWLLKRERGAPLWMLLYFRISVSLQLLSCLSQYLFWRYEISLLGDWIPARENLLHVRSGGQIQTDTLRLSGSLPNPNLLAMVLALSWPFLLGAASGPRACLQRPHAASAFFRRLLLALSVVVLFFTYSRAAYLGFALQLILLVLLAARRGWRRLAVWRGDLLAIGLAIAAAALAVPRVAERMANIANAADASIANRLRVWGIWGRLFWEQPLSGWGAGCFTTLYNRFYRIPQTSYPFSDVHSALLHALFEIGLCGAVLALLAFVGFRPMRTLRHLNPAHLLGLVGCLIPLLSDNPAIHPAFAVPLLFLLAALVRAHADFQPKGPAAYRACLTASAVFLLYLGGHFMPVLSPQARMERDLKNLLLAAGGEWAFFVQDINTGVEWGMQADQAKPSASLSHLAVACAAINAENAGELKAEEPLPMPPKDPRLSGMLASMPMGIARLTAADAQYLMFAASDNLCAHALSSAITSSTMEQTLRDLCRASLNDLHSTSQPLSMQLSPRQAVQLALHIAVRSTPMAEAAKAGMRHMPIPWGLAHRLSANHSYQLGDLSEGQLTNLVMYRAADEWWIACFACRSRGGPSMLANEKAMKAMAEAAWIIYLYMRSIN